MQQCRWLLSNFFQRLFIYFSKTDPSNGMEEDLNLGLPDYKSSALTTRPGLPPQPPKAENNKTYFLSLEKPEKQKDNKL